MADDGFGIFGLIGAALLGIGAVVAVILVAKITYNAIMDYRNKAKQIPNAKTCEVIKKYISSGKYRVVGNVFDKKGKQLDTQAWEGKEIDTRLEREFAGRNKIVYDLTA